MKSEQKPSTSDREISSKSSNKVFQDRSEIWLSAGVLVLLMILLGAVGYVHDKSRLWEQTAPCSEFKNMGTGSVPARCIKYYLGDSNVRPQP